MGNKFGGHRKHSVVIKDEERTLSSQTHHHHPSRHLILLSKAKQVNRMEDNILATANNTFGLNLFKVIRQNYKGENVFMSPLSISSALSMTQIGAREKTALEMAHVLGWKLEDGEKIHKLFQTYLTSLQQPSEQFQLSVANRIYLEQTYPVLEEFKSKTKEWYMAEPGHANFIENAENEATKINSWVEEQTQNKIKDLFGPGVLTSATKMVLVNAIYFKGRWEEYFDRDRTSLKPFKLAPGQTKEVPTMECKYLYRRYRDSELNFSALELPYKGLEFHMLIILPNEVYGLEELVEKFTSETLNTVIDNLTATMDETLVFLPKFEITSSFTLNQPLSSLGMSDAFNTSTADFTGMTGQRDLVLSEVVHKAFVKVNEEGTEAAASTEEVIHENMRPGYFYVDHPFMFAIIDTRASNSVLFLGQVNDPSA